MSSFVRFPHTAHLAWFGPGTPREDKVLNSAERQRLLAEEVTIEEKVDGANLGFSVDEEGQLRAQNRGGYISPRTHPQFKPLKRWMDQRRLSMADALGESLMLFGEWCFAVHSVRYDKLPDWFLVFDVYDRREGRFWSVRRRDSFVEQLGLFTTPRLKFGRFTLESLVRELGMSRLASASMAEGLYVRRDEGEWLAQRAKLVRAEFTQAIERHWSKKQLEQNGLL